MFTALHNTGSHTLNIRQNSVHGSPLSYHFCPWAFRPRGYLFNDWKLRNLHVTKVTIMLLGRVGAVSLTISNTRPFYSRLHLLVVYHSSYKTFR